MVLEFYVKEQSALEAKYAELVDFGYQSYRAPYRTSFGMWFAMVKDPDGNTILISAAETGAGHEAAGRSRAGSPPARLHSDPADDVQFPGARVLCQPWL